MTRPSFPFAFVRRIESIAHRFGLGVATRRQLTEQVSALRLPFPSLPCPGEHIGWYDGLPLQRLVDLPRGALSGPVQEDKASAHSALRTIVTAEETRLERVDLRAIDGLCAEGTAPLAGLESYVGTPVCRGVRIIGYRDFERALQQALPGFASGSPLQLCRAGWRGERLFGQADGHPCALAAAIVYARRRALEVTLPGRLTHYRLSETGIETFARGHIAVAMPAQAWSDPAFMGLLLDNHLPYARLNLSRATGAAELLLLPRSHLEARVIGEGLLAAGAADLVAHLRRLAAQPC